MCKIIEIDFNVGDSVNINKYDLHGDIVGVYYNGFNIFYEVSYKVSAYKGNIEVLRTYQKELFKKDQLTKID